MSDLHANAYGYRYADGHCFADTGSHGNAPSLLDHRQLR